MNRNGIDDQNNDNIIDEPQDILEREVEDDDDNSNEVVHIMIKSQYFGFSGKSQYCQAQTKLNSVWLSWL